MFARFLVGLTPLEAVAPAGEFFYSEAFFEFSEHFVQGALVGLTET